MLSSMPTAYILLCCDLGSESDILQAIELIEEVEEVNRVFGVYDIIVRVSSDNMDKLKEIITTRIRKIDNVRSVLTIIKNEI
ncbi:DNA-binding transcriptional regulator AsnC [Candidatus Nitrosocosmicus franklandus]|uniref:DNA-binding transcriptional regulator AsnC n=2 Tax=Candidatus Nitrosocosmicus franklandianus TaxID=1798806 RepID=A0A484I4G1_9ARCH|nr:DNA-binding transcriptional regulator AsnC [Candidatus Nitrosocosmicus franklandus]